MPLHIFFSTERFVAKGTEPTHVNSTGALRKGRMYRIYIGLVSHDIPLMTSPPPHFFLTPPLSSSSMLLFLTSSTFLLFPSPPHFYFFPQVIL